MGIHGGFARGYRRMRAEMEAEEEEVGGDLSGCPNAPVSPADGWSPGGYPTRRISEFDFGTDCSRPFSDVGGPRWERIVTPRRSNGWTGRMRTFRRPRALSTWPTRCTCTRTRKVLASSSVAERGSPNHREKTDVFQVDDDGLAGASPPDCGVSTIASTATLSSTVEGSRGVTGTSVVLPAGSTTPCFPAGPDGGGTSGGLRVGVPSVTRRGSRGGPATGLRRWANLLIASLILLPIHFPGALASLAISLPPPVASPSYSSSPSSSTSSSPSRSLLFPSSSPLPRPFPPSSSLASYPLLSLPPTLRPRAAAASSTSTASSSAGPPPPPWEDDPCGRVSSGEASSSHADEPVAEPQEPTTASIGAPWLRAEVSHDLFETDSLVPGVVYKVSIEWSPEVEMRRLVVTSRVNTVPGGYFSASAGAVGGVSRRSRPLSPPPGVLLCTGGAVVEYGALTGRSSYALNWTLPATGIDVILRISYLPVVPWNPVMTEAATAASDLSIGVVTQSLRLLSVCELALSHQWGTLSWQDIEYASAAFGGGDCTVHFPSSPPPPPQPPPPIASTSTDLLEAMGLLVDLTRLNVACSQGHLQFGPSARHVFCGKLEEYRPSDRQVHLRGSRERPFLRVHSRIRGTSGNPSRGRKPLVPRTSSFSPSHFPRMQVSFSLRYRPVEPCFNVTLSDRNGTLLIPPPPSSFPALPPPFRPQFERVRCTLTVHLPYGYRLKLKLMLIGGMAGPARPHPGTSASSVEEAVKEREEEEQLNKWSGGEKVKRRMAVEKRNREEEGACSRGVLIGAWEEGPRWTKCVIPNAVTEESSEGNKLVLRIYWGGAEEEPPERNELSSDVEQVLSPPSLLVEYAAVKVDAIVGECGFGWVSLGRRRLAAEEGGRWALDRRKRRVEAGAGLGGVGGQGRRSTCVGAIEGEPLAWGAAEVECVRLGGHLASVRSEEEQAVMDLLLTRSPGYSEHNSYWVGASDVVREGDFRWTDGADFSFSNWFPGWASHGHYNRQPNDDGLSGQDCVELRRAYHLPSAPPPPSSSSGHRPRLAKSTSSPSSYRPARPQTRSLPPLTGGSEVPPHRLSATYAWNDRDCSAANYYVCEREEAPRVPAGGGGSEDHATPGSNGDSSSGTTLDGVGEAGGGEGGGAPGARGSGAGDANGGRRRDCNREIRLGGVRAEGVRPPLESGRRRGKGRADGAVGVVRGVEEDEDGKEAAAAVLLAGAALSSAIVTSPNFPASYPDDVRCETIVKAPPGYRLLLEFEELVLEDEPTCSYDYLEILDWPRGKGDEHRGGGGALEGDGPPRGEDGVGSAGARAGGGGTTGGGAEEDEGEEGGAGGGGPGGVGPGRRLCGDWSSRLKLLRHVTSGRSLTLRFVSDYSRSFGGFRARVSMLSAASIECVDKRLQPFNNSCYLFVGYPEVSWHTAQQICHEMKAELASVLSPSEYRFVTSSIRGSDQYSNSAIYWLGGKLDYRRSEGGGGKESGAGGGKVEEGGGAGGGGEEEEGEDAPGSGWHWVDGSRMVFQAWLPDSPSRTAGADGPLPAPPLCLGVRWMQSPSPHLSGLHWSPEVCSTVGGYVCKRRKGWPPPSRGQARDPETPSQAGPGPNTAVNSHSPTSSSLPALFPTSRGGDESWSPPLVMKDLILRGESGVVTSPAFPHGYPPDVRARVIIVGPSKARLFLRFTALDLEYQPDCLYDYVEVREVSDSAEPVRAERWCGSHTTDLERFDFVSDTNSAEVFFRSDYSVSGAGFSAIWHAVDVSGCPSQTLTASSGAAGETSGVLTSPNHPTALIPRLDCTTTLLAPAGRHVWLEFSESEVFEGGGVELWLGSAGRRPFRPFATPARPRDEDPFDDAAADSSSPPTVPPPHRPLALQHLGDGVFLSAGDRLMVRLWTGDKPRGKGFKATFRAVDSGNSEEHVIILGNNTRGPLLHLNYPDEPPPGMHFVQRLLAPHGHVVRIRLLDVAVATSEDGVVAAPTPEPANATSTSPPALGGASIGEGAACKNPPHLEVRDRYSGQGGGSMWQLCHSPGSVLSLTSYLNSITVVQKYVSTAGKSGESPRLNAMVKVENDPNYKMKLLHSSKYELRAKEKGDEKGLAASNLGESKIPGVESCNPNPCVHGGKCIGGPGMHGRRTCQCKGYYTGLFCALTVCDLEPCVFGLCVLSGDSERGGPGFTCNCYPGYTGITCDERPKPCADNPCEGRGDCLEKGPHSFVCRCHAWWEGQRCERRMLRIPYKPLSERMLHEPFWLGLITVTVVLGIIGLFWCAKRHFPEKLEKLLAEEADRTRHGVPASSSARDNLQSLGGAQGYGIAVEGSHHHHHQAHPGGQQPPHPPRSLFGRLGIRKPSLLSLTGGSGTSAQMQRPQLAQPTQTPPCPNTPAIPDRKPNAPMIPHRQASSSHLLGTGGSQQQPSSSSSAARTFSLDDLLKLPPRRSPSSRKKRNNSSPTRKHSATPSGAAAAAAAVMAEAEKKKILQSLIASAPKPPITTVARLSISLPPSETLSLGECPPNSQANSANMSETKFMGEGAGVISSGDDIVLEEPLPGPPLMPPVPPTASRLDKKVTFARLLSRVSAEMGSSSASGSGSEATPAPKPAPEIPTPSQDSLCAQHPSSPASDESSSVSSSTSSSSFQASTTGASPAVPRKSNRNKIQVTVVDALLGSREGISSTRGPSIFLEPPSSSIGVGDHPPLSPIHEIPSPSPSPTRGGLLSLSKDQESSNTVPVEVGEQVAEEKKGGDEGETDDVEDEEDEEEEEPARVCVTQSPEEEGGGGDGGGGEGGEDEEEEDDEGDDDEGDEDDDDDDEETEEDEDDDEDEEEQEGKAEEEHMHQKQKALSVDAAALEATDDDIGDEGLEEDSPEGMDTMSEETHSSGKCSIPKSAMPTSTLSPPPPLIIPTITVQQPSPTRTTVPNNRPLMMLPIGSPPPRRRLSEHHPYPPPIFFQPPLSPQVSQPSNKRLLLHGPDKPTSLDLPMCPPVITVTATMSESDETEDGCADGNGGRCNSSSYRSSGTNTLCPGGRRISEDNSKCGGQTGMTYLSPFSMCSRGERTASESNLSSSGYSSMASPGPSRAGSNNPLCPSDATDAEDPHQHPSSNHAHHGPHLLLPHHRTGQFLHAHLSVGTSPGTTTMLHPSVQNHHQHYLNLPQGGVGGNGQSSPTCSDHDGSGTPHLSVPSCYSWTRRPSPLLQTPNMEDAGVVERPPGSPPLVTSISVTLRKPQNSAGSNCETVDFNRSSGGEEEEEGNGEVGDGRAWRRRRVERHNSSTTPDSNDEGIGTEGETGKSTSNTQKTLQLPSIVVGVRGASPPPVEAEPGSASKLSPVSSRSESPLSDRVSLPSSSPFGHNSSPRPFSSLFFGKGPPLPLTDSDALYDCPSSEVLGGDDSSTGGHVTQSKGLSVGVALQSPHSITGTSKASNLLEVPHRQGGMQRKVSPKRRVRAPVPICSSSSSSSSLEGIHSKRPSTSTSYVQQSSKCSSSSDRTGSKSIEVPYPVNLQSPTKLQHYQPRKYKHLRGWISPGATDQKKCFEVTLSPHGLASVPHSSNPSSSSTATTPLPNDDANVTGDTAPEIIGKESKWIYGPEKIGLHEALMLPLDGQESLPQTGKICRMKTIGHQIRFLRRLELTLKKRERLASPSDSDDEPQRMDEEDEFDRKEDSSQSSSETTKVPLLPTMPPRNSKEGRYRSSLRRQRRSYDRAGRIGSKCTAPVLEPLLHQIPLSSSSEDEGEKPICRTSPFRQRHANLPTTLSSSAIVSVTTAPNAKR